MIEISDADAMTPADMKRTLRRIYKHSEDDWLEWIKLGRGIIEKRDVARGKAGGVKGGPNYKPQLVKAMGSFYEDYVKLSDAGTLSALIYCVEHFAKIEKWRTSDAEVGHRLTSPRRVAEAYKAYLLRSSIDDRVIAPAAADAAPEVRRTASPPPPPPSPGPKPSNRPTTASESELDPPELAAAELVKLLARRERDLAASNAELTKLREENARLRKPGYVKELEAEIARLRANPELAKVADLLKVTKAQQEDIRSLTAKLREQEKRTSEEHDHVNRLIRTRPGIMTETQYHKLLMALHTDQTITDADRTALLNLVMKKENKEALIKQPPKPGTMDWIKEQGAAKGEDDPLYEHMKRSAEAADAKQREAAAKAKATREANRKATT